MNKYPVYIISKGRAYNPMTANAFKVDGIDFKIAVEPQEYDEYCKAVDEKYIIKLPFSNLGLGSYPARNYCWEDSIKNGYEWHWLFDDNIQGFYRMNKGIRNRVNGLKALQILEDFTERYSNVAISGFCYDYFQIPTSLKKPFTYNTHVYSGMLIKNNLPFRWRLKYNEDVDLCLQALTQKYCTILLQAISIFKTRTTTMMKGGNQTELYQGNKYEKKILKAKSLEEVWPQYVETKIRFNRPHHFVNWKKHFKHGLIKKQGIEIKQGINEYGMVLNATT